MKHKTIEQADEFYRTVLNKAKKDNRVREVTAELGKKDLYFLLTRILKRGDIRHPWLFDRCNEVQAEPNNCLDLWAREHRKSTIITFALTIQDIINDPEITICIFSITRPIARAFLNQIKTELQDNKLLQQLYPDVLYEDPKNKSDRWSDEKGINVKRKTNPKESTVEAYGFIEGLPTSRHYHIRIYDDMIDQKNCTNPDIMKKAIDQWELSLNLGSDRVLPHYNACNLVRYIGTRYHYNDVYAHIMEKNLVKVRRYPGTDDGKMTGEPVYFTKELMEEKRVEMGSYNFGCQILQDPKADTINGFDVEDLRYWWPDMVDAKVMNRFILIDPASKKKKTSDFTTMLVVGMNVDRNYYLLDGVCDRLSLVQRTIWLFRLHRKWRPYNTGYEEYGMQADIEHIQEKMDMENYRFNIIPLGGSASKETRIEKLTPITEAHRYYLPFKLMFQDYQGKAQDLINMHVKQFNDYPVVMHDDILDCLARILDTDLGAEFPELEQGLPFGRDVTMAKTEYSLFGD